MTDVFLFSYKPVFFF